MSNDLDLPALRALCDAATPGPWKRGYTVGVYSGKDLVATARSAVTPDGHSHDAAYIAALHPARVRALLDAVESRVIAALAERAGTVPEPDSETNGDIFGHSNEGVYSVNLMRAHATAALAAGWVARVGEPVAWEFRIKPTWDANHPWTNWAAISAAGADYYIKTPVVGDVELERSTGQVMLMPSKARGRLTLEQVTGIAVHATEAA